jgi:single-strand DNA-binding protein
MAHNNRVELEGNLGKDPRIIEKDGKQFAALSIATTDSYKDDNGQWHNRETIWHNVLIFRPTTITFAKTFKKGDRVRVVGSISYRAHEKADGFKVMEAVIIASYIEKAELTAKEPTAAEVAQAAEAIEG